MNVGQTQGVGSVYAFSSPIPWKSNPTLILENSQVMGMCTPNDGICYVMSSKGALEQP